MKICLGEYGGEVKEIDVNTGMIERHYKDGTVYKGSSDWKATVVIYVNNFGQTVNRISLAEFYQRLKDNRASQFHKNGKAKFRICDIDHGTPRQWGKVYQMCEVFTRG